MRISCVKCSTLYELDEKLLPPGGAPVQCTRCGWVFTAKPSSEAAPLAAKPPAVATAESKPGAPNRAVTQMFGARVGAQLFAAPQTRAPASASAPRAGTQIFGSPVRPSVAQPAGSSTEVAGQRQPDRSGKALAPAKAEHPPFNPRGTQIFGAVAPAPVAPAPVAPAPLVFSSTPPLGSALQGQWDGPVGTGTLLFAGRPSPEQLAAAAAGQVQMTPMFGVEPSSSPPTASADPRSLVNLPPDPAEGPGRGQRQRTSVELPTAQPLFEPDRREDPGIGMGEETGRSNRFVWVAILVALVGLPGFLGIRSILKRRSARPAEVVRAEENALSQLRRDDRRSRQKVIVESESLVRKYPGQVGPTAIQLLALSLDLDDVKLGMKRAQAQSEEVNRQIARLDEKKSAGDSEAQVTAARAQLAALKRDSAVLVDEANALDRRVDAGYSALLTLAKSAKDADEQSSLRAEAIYYGVKGSDKFIPLLERYRQSGARDGWDAIALAEYALNAPTVPGTLAEARARAEQTRSSDSAFLRAYVLAARLALAQRDYEAAATSLDAVVALNPSHEVARQLVGWVDEAKRSDPPKSR